MPTLNWIGKEAVVKHHKDVPFRLLEPVTELSCGPAQGKDSGNLIVQGDNLHALKALLPRYAGQVKCIYIDPPYNTGNEGWVYNDNVNSPEIRRWLGEVVGKEGETLDRHDRWLSMMYPRLVLLKQFLREDGAIFVSIDDNEVGNLRPLMDEIFGARNFITGFIWRKVDSPNDNKVPLTPDHEYVLAYARSKDQLKLAQMSAPSIVEAYGQVDEQGRRYRDRLLKKNGRNSLRRDRPTMYFPLTAPDGSDVYPIHENGEEARWATHGWYSSLGSTAEEAFEKVRGFVVQVADWAAKGDLDAIESFEHLGEAFKWKIAFHYQNRQAPVIVDIFKRAPLAVFTGGTASQSMATLQKAALAKRPEGLGILEFGRQVWEAWSQKNLAVWKLSHGNPPNFTDAERQQYLDGQWAVMHRDTGKEQGKKFAEAPLGALFFLCHGNSPQRIGQFTSAAMPCAKGDGWLQRSYRVLKPAQRTDRYTANSKNWSPQGNSTFWQVGAHDLPEFESTLLKPFFGTDLAELAALAGEPIEAASLGDGVAPPPVATPGTGNKRNATCFNRIYYGPPGTGKTYTLMQLLKRDYEPQAASISTEEWRTQVIAEKVAVLKWWEGAAAALYDLGGKAKVADIAEHRFIQAMTAANGSNRSVRQTLWRTLQTHTVEESSTVKLKKRLSPAVFDKTADSVWQFAGDWQDACADLISLVDQLKAGQQDTATVQRYSFVTFHQSYGYEEFVEGLRPVLNGDAEAGEVEYEIRPGAFKELCRKARQAPDQRFAMVIDEINRGNISKIFGELITLIEPDKRDSLDGGKPPIELTLAYSGEKFSVPANVDIIGTMNTADRSLALLDTALRRRFDFVPLLPDTRAVKVPDEPHSAPLAGLVVSTDVGEIDVRRMLERINERIEALYDRDHCIGHAYFTHLWHKTDGAQRFETLADTFRNRVLPLLEEYFFEDWRKIRLVLGDNQKPDAAQFITESDAHEQALNDLFGDDHGLDSYTTQRRHQLQASAFANPASYLGIYQSLA